MKVSWALAGTYFNELDSDPVHLVLWEPPPRSPTAHLQARNWIGDPNYLGPTAEYMLTFTNQQFFGISVGSLELDHV